MRSFLITMNLIAVVYAALGFGHAVSENQTSLMIAFGLLFVFNGILLKFNVENNQ